MFKWHLNCPFRFKKKKILEYRISWNSVQWESSCSIRTDGQIDITKLIVAFCNFAKASKKSWHISDQVTSQFCKK